MPADPLGATLGTLGLLTAALEVFRAFESGRSFGKDFTILFYRLQFEGLRLQLWAEESKLQLVSEQGLDVLPEPLGRPGILGVAKHCISIIALLLLEAGPISRRYRPVASSAAAGEGSSSFHPENQAEGMLVVNSDNREQSIQEALRDCLAQLQADVKRFQKSSSAFDKFMWAISRRSKFEEIVSNIHIFTDNLYNLLPRFQVSYLDRTFLNRTLDAQSGQALRAIRDAAQEIYEDISRVATVKDLQLSSHSSLVQERPISVSDLKFPKVLLGVLPRSNARWFPDSISSCASYELVAEQRIFVEWKQYGRDLDDSVKEKIKENAFDLSLCLQFNHQRKNAATIDCLGFFNDPYADPSPRLGYVYSFPKTAEQTQNPVSLLDLLAQRPPPDLGQRITLASRICEAFYYFFTSNWLHKSIRSSNILFFRTSSSQPNVPDLASPYITGFEYSRPDNVHGISLKPGESVDADRYRHPDYSTPSLRTANTYEKKHDIFSLGVILLEIGLWQSVAALSTEIERSNARRKRDPVTPPMQEFQSMYVERFVKELPYRIGTKYAKAVERCLLTKFEVEEGEGVEDGDGQGLVRAFDRGVVIELAQCSI